jgi:hypothetical protein
VLNFAIDSLNAHKPQILFYLVSRLFFFSLFALAASDIIAQREWTLKKDADSVKVYTSHTEESAFKSIKAIFTVNTTMSQLASMVWNVERYDEWQYNTIVCKTLKKINEHEMIYYAEIEAPWPITNRDMVVRLKVSQNDSTKVLTIDTVSEPAFIPEDEDLVRVPMSKAQWIVAPAGENKVSVEYTIQIDPGGSVPAWMVNMVCVEAPYESFTKLRSKIATQTSKLLPYIID